MALSAWISFKYLWERATKRLSDRGERIVGAKFKNRKRQLLLLRERTLSEPNDRLGMDWE